MAWFLGNRAMLLAGSKTPTGTLNSSSRQLDNQFTNTFLMAGLSLFINPKCTQK